MTTRLGSFLLIREQEYRHVAYFFGLFFLIGGGMAMGRGTADALFFKRYGIEYLPVMYIVVSILLCVTSIGYAAFADRIPADRFFNILFGSLIGLLLLNWFLITHSETTLSYPIYFLIYEVASELLTVHAVHYISQNFEVQQVKRLTPLIMGGSQLGVIAGGLVLASSSRAIGVQNFLLVWGLVLAASFVLVSIWHSRHGISPYFRPRHTGADKLGQAITEVQQGIRFMRTSRLLRALSVSLFFMVITFYVLCYSGNRIYTSTFNSEESLSAFFGTLTAVNSTIALLLQIFVTNRLLRRFGARRVNLVFPVTSILSYVGLLASFSFHPALFSSLNKDALMPAFRNPVRNMFFNALPENMQGRARATAIVVVLPLALSAGGMLLWVMQHMGNPVYFLVPGLMAACCYLYFSNKMSKAYASEMAYHLKQKLFVPEHDRTLTLEPEDHEAFFNQLARGLRDRDNRITLDFAKMLNTAFPDRAPGLILQRMGDFDDSTRDRVLRLLAPNNPPELHDYLRSSLSSPDNHLKATALKTLFSLRGDAARGLPAEYLACGNPRLQAAAVFGVLRYADASLLPEALACWEKLVTSESLGARLASLELMEHLPEVPDHSGRLSELYKRTILALLSGDSPRARELALRSLRHWPAGEFPELAPFITDIYTDGSPALQIECLKCCHLLPAASREPLVATAIEDSHSDVRAAAVDALLRHADEPLALLAAWLTVENRGSPRAQQSMLNALLARDTPRAVIEQIALAKATDARQVLRASGLLAGQSDNQNPALELMRYTLDDKFLQLVDLSLSALQALEHAQDINVVRAAIRSRDKRHTSSAFEVLHSMRKQKVARVLCDILEDAYNDGDSRHKAGDTPFDDVKSVLLWCKERADPWLQVCANQALRAYT